VYSNRELTTTNEVLSSELQQNSSELASIREEFVQMKADNEMIIDSQKVEIESLLEQSERLIKQNSNLLRQMVKLESNSSEVLSSSAISNNEKTVNVSGKSSASPSKKATNELYDQKLLNLRNKLSESEARAESYIKRNDALLSELREKNDIIRDLKRNISTISTLNSSRSLGGQGADEKEVSVRNSPSYVASSSLKEKDELIANLYDEINRLKTEKKVRISTPASEAAEAKTSSGTLYVFIFIYEI
jgi:hypothetical protein